MAARKTHCKHGHDISVVGRTAAGHCRPCLQASKRKHARRTYGIENPTAETKEGPCDICGSVVSSLHLDHAHNTGAVRGWLCRRCNPGLGFFNDNIETLKKAIAYLEKQ